MGRLVQASAWLVFLMMAWLVFAAQRHDTGRIWRPVLLANHVGRGTATRSTPRRHGLRIARSHDTAKAVGRLPDVLGGTRTIGRNLREECCVCVL